MLATIPPRRTQSPPKITPISNKTSGTHTHNSRVQFRTSMDLDLAEEIEGQFVGPMPPDEFLTRFLQTDHVPAASGDSKVLWARLVKAEAEPEMYSAFIEAARELAKGFKFVDTHKKPDTWCGELSPDVSAYQRCDSGAKGTDFSRIEFFVEFEHATIDDPFCDDPEPNAKGTYPFERDSNNARKVRGQLASYSAALVGSQFRIHAFSIFICGRYARLMRWDRSGAVVTKRFEYAAPETPFLSEFLLRYSYLTAFARGHDPTVTAAADIDKLELKTTLSELAKRNRRHREIRRMRIHDRDASNEELDDPNKGYPYLISYPPYYSCRSPFGRATRGMVAYNEIRNILVFIKDYWRPAVSEIEKEGDVYRSLEDSKVPFIAPFGHGNDLAKHETCTHKLMDESWALRCRNLDHLQHYRMSLNRVGRHLTDFRSTCELVTAIADAMEAHDVAYFGARVLHRDISVGNIMIGHDGVDEGKDDGRGFLIDWDLCIRLDVLNARWEGDGHVRRARRTGTWQFMSAALCSQTGLDTDQHQDIADDRESAFYVLTWVALRYTRHNTLANLHKYMKPYDEKDAGPTGTIEGGSLKKAMLQNPFEVAFDERPQLDALIEELKDTLAVRYMKRPSAEATEFYNKMLVTDPAHAGHLKAADYVKGEKMIKEKSWLVTTFRRHLGSGSWPLNDKAEANSLGEGSLKKRKRQDVDLETWISHSTFKSQNMDNGFSFDYPSTR